MDFPFLSSCKLWLLVLQIMQLSVSFFLYAGNETDMQSLLAFKAQITHDPLGVLASWNHSLHFCQWSGVNCGRRHQRVVELELNSSKLQGTLSPHVGNLSFLRILHLHNNSFTHQVPEELGRLSRLRRLNLGNNTFGGVIPVNISRCSNLLYLNLQVNNFTGKLPAELGTLSKLELLAFSHAFSSNNLVGELPPSLGNLSSIMEIHGCYNNFQGGIPTSIGQLKRLSILTLASNNLTGMIPSSVYNLSSLMVFEMGENNFHGRLPSNLFQTLPNLKAFSIYSNQQFSGQIPVTLSNASHLYELQLSENNFVGKVPTMAGLPNLTFLSVDDNDLGEGDSDDLSFLYSLANNTNLEELFMNDNNFGGELPKILSNFSTTLRKIIFGRNQIRGRIPTEIGNLVNLEILGLEENQVAGMIPTSVGNLQRLTRLVMGSNKIDGSIPSSLGNITSLLTLDLSDNKLQERIPLSLGNCHKLLEMSLAGNKLSGSIPEEVISISSLSISMDLSRNQLTGSLPIEVGKLVSLGALDISDNKLWGEIPTSLANCRSLETLNFGENFFQGNIPENLKALRAIQYFNLSHNNFTGKIFKFLAEFKLLESLDLSFNNFEGEVPVNGVFEYISKISVKGNKNLCGGMPQLNLHKCSESQEQNSSTKLLLIIAIACGCLGIILMIFFVIVYCMRKEKKLLSRFSLEKFLKRVTYEDLHQATDGFSSSSLIGMGSFGSVYKALLNPDRVIVAVKVLNLSHKGALKSFMTECKALINMRHRNLVQVITVCSSIDFQGNDFKALVYEFMVNGDVDKWLHPIPTSAETREERILNLVQRLNIAIDVVSALHYLHHHCQPPIIHCDLKPSNILLDSDMTAHIGDFGLARFLGKASDELSLNQSSSIGLKGTIGYAAPEYGVGSEVSTYGDVYSFGILLLEMFTGKRPTDTMFKDGFNLHNFVREALPESVLDVAAPTLLLEQEQEQKSIAASRIKNHVTIQKFLECMIMILNIGVACSAESPRDRMDIRSAEVELHHIRDILFGARMRRQHEICSQP